MKKSVRQSDAATTNAALQSFDSLSLNPNNPMLRRAAAAPAAAPVAAPVAAAQAAADPNAAPQKIAILNADGTQTIQTGQQYAGARRVSPHQSLQSPCRALLAW